MNSRPKLTFASFFALLQSTFTAFGEDRVGRHAAALAYFTVFSISPLFLIIISIAALYFQDQAQTVNAIQGQLEGTLGSTAAKAVEEMIQGANGHGGDTAKPITATLIALGVALWGASGLFGALQDSLNSIWGVMPDPKLGFLSVVRSRFISFGMVLGVGFLLLVSLVMTTVLSVISKKMSGVMGDSVGVAWILNFGLGLGISMLLFAAIYKILPDAKIQWRDVWVGAFVTALLFSLGRLALGVYLGRPQVASAYGSAGALVVLLLWVNYAATILFVGAEFTKAYANKFGSKITPDANAVLLSPEARAKQGFSPQSAPSPLSPMAANGTKGAILVAGDVVKPNKPAVSDAQKQAFEHSLAVVSGAIIVVLWTFRRRTREREED